MSSSAPCAPSNRMRLPSRRLSSSSGQTGSMIGQHLRRDRGQLVVDRCAARSRSCRGRGAARCDAPAAARSCRRASAGRRDPSAGSRAGRPCPRRPGRCRARSCRSRPCRTPSRARRRAPGAAAGSAGHSRRCADCRGVTATPCAFSRSISSISACGSSTTPLPITDSLPRPHHAGRQQRQLVGHAVDDQRMAGVVAALEANDDVGLLRQPVDDLALALVAPLRADHHHIRHSDPFPQARNRSDPIPRAHGANLG